MHKKCAWTFEPSLNRQAGARVQYKNAQVQTFFNGSSSSWAKKKTMCIYVCVFIKSEKTEEIWYQK